MSFPEEGTIPVIAWDMAAHDGTGRIPQVSNPYRADHKGVDFALRAEPWDPAYDGTYTAARTKNYFSPEGWFVQAAGDGKVEDVGDGARGSWVRIAHTGTGFFSIYRHLAPQSVFAKKGAQIKRGTFIGLVDRDPSGPPFRHLHFEMKRWDPTTKQARYVDPEKYMDGWDVRNGNGATVRERWRESTRNARRSSSSDDDTSRGKKGGWLWLLAALLLTRGRR